MQIEDAKVISEPPEFAAGLIVQVGDRDRYFLHIAWDLRPYSPSQDWTREALLAAVAGKITRSHR